MIFALFVNHRVQITDNPISMFMYFVWFFGMNEPLYKVSSITSAVVAAVVINILLLCYIHFFLNNVACAEYHGHLLPNKKKAVFFSSYTIISTMQKTHT